MGLSCPDGTRRELDEEPVRAMDRPVPNEALWTKWARTHGRDCETGCLQHCLRGSRIRDPQPGHRRPFSQPRQRGSQPALRGWFQHDDRLAGWQCAAGHETACTHRDRLRSGDETLHPDAQRIGQFRGSSVEVDRRPADRNRLRADQARG